MRDDLSDDAIARLPAGRSLEGVEFCESVTVAPTWWRRRRSARIANFAGDPTTAAYRTTHENQRIKRLARRLATDGFRCEECGEELPLHRNADRKFCRPICKRRSWERRRRLPSADPVASGSTWGKYGGKRIPAFAKSCCRTIAC